MKYLPLILVLICTLAFPDNKPINEKYSYKAFPYHNVSFKDRPAEEFNNTIIIGSCFYQEATEDADELREIEKDIFPDGITGVIFKKCNLDNVYVPLSNTVEDGSTNDKIKVQNDLADWVLDDELKPAKPCHKDRYQNLGLSIDPKDIPKKKMKENIYIKKERELEDEKIAVNP